MDLWIPTSQLKIVVVAGKEVAQMEAAARKMVEADKILVAHMIAIVGKVLPRMIAAVRMMVADHRLQDYC